MAKPEDEEKQPAPLKADDWAGPPQAQPWDNWTPEQHAHAEKMIGVLDGIKLYRSAGGAGVGVQHRQNAIRLAQQGGLDPDEALTLARYRMSKQPKGPTPTGEREPAETDDDIRARSKALFAAPKEERAGMMADEKARGYLTQEGYYDSLARKRPEPEPAPNEVADSRVKLEPAKPAPAAPDATAAKTPEKKEGPISSKKIAAARDALARMGRSNVGPSPDVTVPRTARVPHVRGALLASLDEEEKYGR